MSYDKIAIVGKMHSGKSTLATLLAEQYGYTRLAMAGPVKDMTARMINAAIAYVETTAQESPRGEIPHYYNRDVVNNYKATLRPLLQYVGTDLCRNFLYDPEIWIRLFLAEQVRYDRVVVDDIRFLNEAATLKAAEFHLVRIIRPEGDRLASLESSGTDAATTEHASETEIDAIETDRTVICYDLEAIARLGVILGGAGDPAARDDTKVGHGAGRQQDPLRDHL